MTMKNEEMSREGIIVRTSIIGIAANLFLAAFKAAVGILAGSIAVVLDAVNNLSDALSSLITIIGTKLASKKPDSKHPYGYGRIEYLSATIISVIVLYAGVTSLVESVKKIITPETPDYSVVSLIIIAAGVAVKILLGRYVKGVGEKVDSDSLVNSGEDATNDAVISSATLVAAVLFMMTGLSLEAYLAAVISVVIIKSGIEMLSDMISRMLGERVDSELSKEIKATVASVEGARGAYDLFLHDYGPDRMMGSVHVEVPDTMTADQLDVMTRTIEKRVFAKHHVALTAVGFYSHNTKNDESAKIYENIRRIVSEIDHVLQIHGFYCDLKEKTIRFDAVVDFKAPDRNAVWQQVCAAVLEAYPDYKLTVALDADTAD
ncbi:MAG: cation diffusion facilitator family transporter [Erysipelotrichaceae bacterium]|nr:cation diffusion facilitator family transporter [Erysipelotrichaceae bacterium]